MKINMREREKERGLLQEKERERKCYRNNRRRRRGQYIPLCVFQIQVPILSVEAVEITGIIGKGETV